jgi:hypothetical protein
MAAVSFTWWRWYFVALYHSCMDLLWEQCNTSHNVRYMELWLWAYNISCGYAKCNSSKRAVLLYLRHRYIHSVTSKNCIPNLIRLQRFLFAISYITVLQPQFTAGFAKHFQLKVTLHSTKFDYLKVIFWFIICKNYAPVNRVFLSTNVDGGWNEAIES